jgi:hypothetical protein
MQREYDEMMQRLIASTLIIIKIIAALIIWAIISMGFNQAAEPGLTSWNVFNAVIIAFLIFRSQSLVDKYQHMQTFENFYEYLEYLKIKPKED